MKKSTPVLCYLALGSNLGDRWQALREAASFLAGLEGSRLLRGSSVYETPPVGPPGQAPYLNAVVEVETSWAPEVLLEALKGHERAAGRVEGLRWGPRVIDLDILLYGQAQVESERLVIPHVELGQRAFVLVPLHELSPLLWVPRLEQSVEQCLVRQADRAAIQKVGDWCGSPAPGWWPLEGLRGAGA